MSNNKEIRENRGPHKLTSKPSEIISKMEESQQITAAFRNDEGNKFCFAGAIMKVWNLFNNSAGVEIHEFKEILNRKVAETDKLRYGIADIIIGRLTELNDQYSFAVGKKKAVEYLESFGL